MSEENFKKSKIVINTITAAAGFPSPAENYIEEYLNLNKYLINNIEATFFIRVSGDSMINVGIYNNDIIIVDRSISPKNRSIVVASLNGELVIKRFLRDRKGKFYLKSENKNYPKIILNSEVETTIWGVVTHAIHHLS
jgi:DNA polymerase V